MRVLWKIRRRTVVIAKGEYNEHDLSMVFFKDTGDVTVFPSPNTESLFIDCLNLTAKCEGMKVLN